MILAYVMFTYMFQGVLVGLPVRVTLGAISQMASFNLGESTDDSSEGGSWGATHPEPDFEPAPCSEDTAFVTKSGDYLRIPPSNHRFGGSRSP